MFLSHHYKRIDALLSECLNNITSTPMIHNPFLSMRKGITSVENSNAILFIMLE